MSPSEDVANLFRKFGGEAEEYQELARETQAAESKARWPLLASVHLADHAVAPSVKDGSQPVSGAPVPNLQGREQEVGPSPFASAPEVPAMAPNLPGLPGMPNLPGLSGLRRPERARVNSVGNTLFKTGAGAASAGSQALGQAHGQPRSTTGNAAATGATTATPAGQLASLTRRAVERSGGRARAAHGTHGVNAIHATHATHGSQARVEPRGTAVAQAPAAAAAPLAARAPVPSVPVIPPVSAVPLASVSEAAAPSPLAARLRKSGLETVAEGKPSLAEASVSSAVSSGNAPAPTDGARPLSAVFSRLAGGSDTRETPTQPKNSLFARLSRL